ncbi:MAG: RagB/SusD family nutrient uptake outer membrane protein [Flavobacteriaceae bacterium]|nr:MAG: RagB/SusD family nutrient uptake outer membrane protein [Flavobacteriaceae bacterium]
MKSIIKNIVFVCAIVAMIFSTSCTDEFEYGDDFLVKQPSTDVTEDTIFNNAVYARKFLWNNYKNLHYGLVDPTNFGRQLGSESFNVLGDDCQGFLNWANGSTYYYNGLMNASREGNNSKHNYKDSRTWKGIRAAWVFIENADRVPNFDKGEKKRLVAEAKMIIACNYSDMFRHFGGLPLVKKALRPTDDTNLGRATIEETVSFITNLCDEAADDLPWKLDVDEKNTWSGRFTAASALGLKVRVLLFAASPIFNSGNTWNGVENESVANLQSTYGNYDSQRWQKTVDACEVFFNRNGGGLTPDGGVYYLNQNGDYRLAYRDAYYNRSNPGMLISTRRVDKAPSKWNYRYFPTIWVRWNGLLPTLDGLNAFPKSDGSPFLEADMPWLKSNSKQQEALTNNTYVDPFENRDPRLYETAHISGKSYYNGHRYAGYMGGQDRGDKEDGTKIQTSKGLAASGFTNYKFTLNFNNELSGKTIHWPYLRLSEIYLSYAEALNMVGRSSEAYQWVDAVRARVGLKGIMASNPERKSIAVTHPDMSVSGSSDEFLLKEILRERNCEFTAEEVRFFDLVRWRCEDDFKKRLSGLLFWRYKKNDGTIVNDYSSFVFNKFPLNKRYIQDGEQGKAQVIKIYPENRDFSISKDPHNGMWSPKWYLSAFPTTELNKNYGLTQNPGW